MSLQQSLDSTTQSESWDKYVDNGDDKHGYRCQIVQEVKLGVSPGIVEVNVS